MTIGANIPITITGNASAGNPWRVQADSQTTNVSNPSNNPLPPSNPVLGQKTPVTVYDISLHVSSTSCSFPVTGYISTASYFNVGGGATLTLAAVPATVPTLTVGAVTLLNGATNCLAGAVHTGDKMTLATTYSVHATNAADPIWVNAR